MIVIICTIKHVDAHEDAAQWHVDEQDLQKTIVIINFDTKVRLYTIIINTIIS